MVGVIACVSGYVLFAKQQRPTVVESSPEDLVEVGPDHFCTSNYVRVKIFTNNEGVTGGYFAIPPIERFDASSVLFDTKGKIVAYGSIHDTEKKRARTEKIMTDFFARFPNEKMYECPRS